MMVNVSLMPPSLVLSLSSRAETRLSLLRCGDPLLVVQAALKTGKLRPGDETLGDAETPPLRG